MEVGLVKSVHLFPRNSEGIPRKNDSINRPRTFVKTTAPIGIFCGSKIPDKNLKSIEILQKCCENTLDKKKLDGKYDFEFWSGMSSANSNQIFRRIYPSPNFSQFRGGGTGGARGDR